MRRYKIKTNNNFADVIIADNVDDKLLDFVANEYKDYKTKVLWFDPPYGFSVKSDVETPVDIELFFKKWMQLGVPAVGYWGVVPLIFRWYDVVSTYLPFKQDFVWAKTRTTTPLLPVKRQHENFYFHAVDGWRLGVGRVPSLISDGMLRSAWESSAVFIKVRKMLTDKEVLQGALDQMGDNAWSATDWANYLGVEYKKRPTPDLKLFNPLKEPVDSVPSNVVFSKSPWRWLHPTAKNVNAVYSFLLSTIPGNGDVLVIDPFAGSAVISIVALALGYDTVAIEMYDKYYDIIKSTATSILSANGIDFEIVE